MSVQIRGPARSGTRAPLTRQRVLEAALCYIDEHGLEALSMHKLGADLGVRGMSLYNHVRSKEDLLDGVANLLWAEVPQPCTASWHEIVRVLARSLRDMVVRHPRAARLVVSGEALPEHGLLMADSYLNALHADGVPEEHAVPLLRTVIAYSLGQALGELSWSGNGVGGTDDESELARIRRVGRLLPPDAPERLLGVALAICGDCDMSTQFDFGIDVMIRGLDAYVSEGSPSAR